MELTRVEGWMLSNQLRILEALYPNEAESLARDRKALEEGYALNYDWGIEHIYQDELSVDDCKEVFEILDMHWMMQSAYRKHGAIEGLKEKDLSFRGYDGNHETPFMSYVRYVIEDLKRYESLNIDADGFNSHSRMQSRYLDMVSHWRECGDKHNLTPDDVRRILGR